MKNPTGHRANSQRRASRFALILFTAAAFVLTTPRFASSSSGATAAYSAASIASDGNRQSDVCDLEDGYARSGDDGSCQRLFSTDACSYGKWFALDVQVTGTFRCVEHPCGGDTTRVALRNKTCVPADAYMLRHTLVTEGYCGKGQLVSATPTGVLDCECSEGLYYWPESNACYQPFSRGPCKDDEILAFPSARKTSGGAGPAMQCQKNHCAGQERVAYSEKHGYCFRLDTQGPCKRGYTFTFNHETLKVGCFRKTARDVDYIKTSPFLPGLAASGFLDVPCTVGSVRSYHNSCVDTGTITAEKDVHQEDVTDDVTNVWQSRNDTLPRTLLTKSSCKKEEQWRIVNPTTGMGECRKIQCSKQDELLMTSGVCMGAGLEMDEWCSSVRGTKLFRLALTAHGTVECECSLGQGFWPPDRKCYSVYTEGPCRNASGPREDAGTKASRWMLVYTGGPQLRSTNGLECRVNPCERREELFWKSDGKCYTRWSRGPCKPWHVFTIDTRTLQPYCKSEIPGLPGLAGLPGLPGLVGLPGLPDGPGGPGGPGGVPWPRPTLFGMLEVFRPCKRGSLRDFKGHCQKYMTFVFH